MQLTTLPTNPSPQCLYSSTNIVLACAVSVIVTALIATAIFIVVQITICKCHPNFRPGGTEIGIPAGGEGQEYEQVDEGGVAATDPTYMEVGAGGGENAFELKENEAYASRVAR